VKLSAVRTNEGRLFQQAYVSDVGCNAMQQHANLLQIY